MGIIESLHEYVSHSQIAAQMLTLANSSCQMLLQTIEQISELSRIRLNKFMIIDQEFHIRDDLIQILKVIKIQAEFKQLQMRLEVERQVPKLLTGDKDRILMVIKVLLGNSLKYTERGEIKLSIRITNPPVAFPLGNGLMPVEDSE